ncbi:MAG: class I SAM-dependent methyltransferase family protein [Candidatus Aenigmarchaeota archaeon]|nr:class I SAM-dependent methyltransferase family protein [Candidatus Aenigmarchaeota archaeon]
MDLKEALRSKLTDKELQSLKTSFDVIGHVAILEIPEGLVKKEKIIAQALLKLHKNVKTVCKKSGERSGTYRLRKLKKLAGNGFETVHKESGCLFKLDPRKAYFSVRESTERLRLAQELKPKEKILVLFSGIGPFGIVAAKKQPGCIVDMVEINPTACEYAEENIRLNKVQESVKSFCGDANKVTPSKKYDRIVMPLPETAYRFLDIAVSHCKKGGIIYLYAILGKENTEVEEEIKKHKLKIVNKRNVLPYAPGVWKVCLELKVD